MSNSECCREGYVHSASPKGNIKNINNIPTYISTPDSIDSGNEHKAIVLFTDVFGLPLPNIKIIADKLSVKTACSVYIPDICDNDPISLQQFNFLLDKETPGILPAIIRMGRFVINSPTFISWIRRHTLEKTLPIVTNFITGLKLELGVERIATYGFCFGGRYSILMGGTNDIDVCIAAHPSLSNIHEIEKIIKPCLFICAENDFAFPESLKRKAQETLDKNTEFESQFITFKGVSHGFSVRGDEQSEIVEKAATEALDAAAQFIKKHL